MLTFPETVKLFPPDTVTPIGKDTPVVAIVARILLLVPNRMGRSSSFQIQKAYALAVPFWIAFPVLLSLPRKVRALLLLKVIAAELVVVVAMIRTALIEGLARLTSIFPPAVINPVNVCALVQVGEMPTSKAGAASLRMAVEADPLIADNPMEADGLAKPEKDPGRSPA